MVGMRVSTVRDELFLATVRVLGSHSVATALLFQHASAPNAEPSSYIVTNRHVVEDEREADLFFVTADDAGRPVLGSPYIFHCAHFAEMWTYHPQQDIDVAVARFDRINADLDRKGVNVANRWITSAIALDQHPFDPQIDEHPWTHLFGVDIDSLEDVFFVGYPSGYFDQRNHLPIARRGTAATPIAVDFRGNPTFLIDAVILPGSSGSPVFIADSRSTAGRSGRGGNERLIFLGIVTEFLPYKEPGKPPRRVESEQDRLRLLTGLGLVYKPSTILETIAALEKADDSSSSGREGGGMYPPSDS